MSDLTDRITARIAAFDGPTWHMPETAGLLRECKDEIERLREIIETPEIPPMGESQDP